MSVRSDLMKLQTKVSELEDRIKDMELWTGFKCGDCDGSNLKSDPYGHRWCDDCEPNKYHIPPFPENPLEG